MKAEATAFGKIAKTDAATALVGIFLNDQAMKKTAGKWEKKAKPVAQAVMFCLMDVSGSMSEHMKDLAKRGKRVLGLEKWDVPHARGSSHGYRHRR